MTPGDDEMRQMATDTYVALADLLYGLDPADWDTPSLCEGWRLREVAAHVTMPARYDQEAFMAELREADFDFTTLSNRVATRDGALPTGDLVSALRSDALHRWEPPGGGASGALTHVVVHSLDATIPLGAASCASDDALRAVLDLLTTGGAHEHFGIALPPAMEATDVDWRYGDGPPVRGQAADLVLTLTGRTRSAQAPSM